MTSDQSDGVVTDTSQPTSKHKKSGIEIVYVPAEEIEKSEEGYTITCPDGTKLSSRSDYLVAKTNLEGNTKFYISYYTVLNDGIETRCVNMLDVQTLLDKFPKCIAEMLELKIEKIENNSVSSTTTLLLEEWDILLCYLGIDREMITAVNNMDYTLGARNLLKQSTSPIIVKTAEGKEAMFPSQAIFYIFLSVVTKVNFRIELCEEHPNCIDDFRKKVVRICETLSKVKPHNLIFKSTVQEMIRLLTKHCSLAHHLRRPKEQYIGFLSPTPPDRFVEKNDYEKIIDHYGLPNISKFMEERFSHGGGLMTAFDMRGQLMLGWMYSVYGDEQPKSRSYLMDAILYLFEDDRKDELRARLLNIMAQNDMSTLLEGPSMSLIEKKAAAGARRKEELRLRKGKRVVKESPKSFVASEDDLRPVGCQRFPNFEVNKFPTENLRTTSNGFEGEYPNIGVLTSNTSVMTRGMAVEFKMKYFVVDKEDMVKQRRRKGYRCLVHFSDFYDPDSPIFVRSFRIIIAGVESIRVLTDDVIELVPLLLMHKSECKKSEIKERLEKCRAWWGEENTTIPLHSFERFVDECIVVKSDVKIIEDMAYKVATDQYRKEHAPIFFPNHHNQNVMFASHAALFIFDRTVFGANWKVDYCREHKNCLADYRQKIVETVQQYESNRLYGLGDIMDDMKALTSHCSYRKLFPEPRSGVWSIEEDKHGLISTTCYEQCCEEYGIPDILMRETPVVIGSLAKILLKLGWLVVFLGTSRVVTPLLDALAMVDPVISPDIHDLWKRYVIGDESILPYKFNPVPGERQIDEETSSIPASSEPIKSDVVEYPEPVDDQKNELLMVDSTASKPELSPLSTSSEPSTSDVVKNPEPAEDHNKDSPIDDNTPAELEEDATPSEAGTAAPSESQDGASVADSANEKPAKSKKSTKKPKAPQPKKSVVEETPLEREKRRNDYLETEMQKMTTKMNNLQEKMKNANENRNIDKKAREEAERKAETLEKLAKKAKNRGQRLSDREMELGERKKIIEKLTKRLESQSEQVLRVNELEKKAKDRKKIEEDLRSSNKNLQIKNESLEQTVTDLSKKLEAVQEKSNKKLKNMTEELTKLKVENKILTSQNQKQAREKAREISDLKSNAYKKHLESAEKNSRLISSNNYLTSAVDGLKQQVEQLKTTLNTRETMTPPISIPSNSPGPSDNVTTSVRELRAIKDRFERVEMPKIMQNGREMVVKLLALKDDEETRELTQDELNALENSAENYLEILNLNIRIFIRTNDASNLLPHPETPKLSIKFMNLYSELESQHTGIPDTDCVICHMFRHEHEEKIACHRCPRIYHKECLRTWYKQDQAGGKCPTCKVVLHDPDEYPPLR